VRVGLVQDFAETLLTGLLSRFARLHGEAQLQVRVAGSAELLELLASDRLDVVLCMGAADDPAAVTTAPMVWLGDPALAALDVLPLAVLEPPCRFRDAALAALNWTRTFASPAAPTSSSSVRSRRTKRPACRRCRR
jgi:DNA-binding transcriptional LysR family regulator